MPSALALAPASAPSSKPGLALDAQPDQRPHLGAQLDRLIIREVAEVRHLDLPVGVLVDRQRVDHSDCVARTQALQLGDDPTVEIRFRKSQNDQLDRSDGHGSSSPGCKGRWESCSTADGPASGPVRLAASSGTGEAHP